MSATDRAADHLRFIRETMERAGVFTAVSGWGQVVVGFIGLAAAAVAARQPTPRAWLTVWLTAAALAVIVDFWAIRRKARRLGVPLVATPARRFALSFSTPLLAGACLTGVLAYWGMPGLLPGMWLLLFGTAVVTGGALSVRVVPLMGMAFMTLGLAALLSPPSWGDLYMAAGFGLLNIVFGLVIATRHGG
jgi:hypothetical protein